MTENRWCPRKEIKKTGGNRNEKYNRSCVINPGIKNWDEVSMNLSLTFAFKVLGVLILLNFKVIRIEETAFGY